MKLIPNKKILSHSVKLTAIASLTLLMATPALADWLPNTHDWVANASRRLSRYTLDCGHWYVAGNIGMSHLFDKVTPASANSVDENGPGWDAAIGYQFNSILGGELGYTQYYNSRETSATTVVAKTEHFAVHLNATGRYPLFDKFSLLGKLGIAYSYAQKVFSATGAAGSAGAVSPYYGLGLEYSLTRRVDMIAQWTRARGNNYTGSSDLYSVGMTFAIV